MKFVVGFCLLFSVVYAKHEIYDGSAVYEVNVKNVDEIKLINDLENELLLDVWSHALPGKPGQILVSKEQSKTFEDALKAAGVDYKIEVENIKELLDIEDQKLAAAASRSSRNSSRLSFDTIHTYEEVDAYLEELARAYPNVVTLVLGGTSFQGRPIKYIRISNTNFQDTSKPVVIMQSLLHAREWVTLPATLYAIEKLVIDVTDPDLINNVDWIILPVVNPDGYVWTHTNSRFWRKNRRTGLLIGDICVGVDLNRNFDMNWSTASSNNVCSDTYHGTRAASEPETQVVANILAEHRGRVALFLDIHSFGSMILYGYGNGVLPPNGLFLHLVGILMAQEIDRVKWASNPNYVVGNIAHVLYDASGGASDYGMVAGATYSYTYELPAYRNIQGTLNGFLVDPDFIEQAGYETWEGIKAGVRYVANI